MAEIDEKTREALCKVSGEFESWRRIERQLKDYAELLKALECVAQRPGQPVEIGAGYLKLDDRFTDHDGRGPSIAAALIRAAKDAEAEARPMVRVCARCGDKLDNCQTRCDDEGATGATTHFICGGEPTLVAAEELSTFRQSLRGQP